MDLILENNKYVGDAFWLNYNNCDVKYTPPENSEYPFGTYDPRLDSTNQNYDPNFVYDPESDPNFDFTHSYWRYQRTNGNEWSLNDNTYSKTVNGITYSVECWETEREDSNSNWDPFFLECVGNADIVIIPNSYNNTSDINIYLPIAGDFPNKIIEIYDYRYMNSNPDSNFGVVSVTPINGGYNIALSFDMSYHNRMSL
jgi:hypothetical protein